MFIVAVVHRSGLANTMRGHVYTVCQRSEKVGLTHNRFVTLAMVNADNTASFCLGTCML